MSTALRENRAGIVTRALAAVVDAIMLALLVGLVYLGLAGVRFLWSPLSFSWPAPHPALSAIAIAVGCMVYLAVGWVTTGRTYGAGLMGVRVLSADLTLLRWPAAGVRAVACVLFPFGLLWTAFSPSRRSLQDIVVRSIVLYDTHLDGGRRVRGQPPGRRAAS